MTRPTLLLSHVLLAASAFAFVQAHAQAQTPEPLIVQPSSMDGQPEARQTAEILGIAVTIEAIQKLQSQRACSAPPSSEERLLRLELLEAESLAFADVDSVVSEIAAERASLTDLRTSLQMRRDRTVGYLNAAALITGSGIGVAVNATQLSNSSAIAGDYVGIGSGITSTALSILAIKKMHGPKQSVGTIPNMLAPLFDKTPVLKTAYAPPVQRYLESIPPSEDPAQGTRLEQLKAGWITTGRIDASDSAKNRGKITALTSSMDDGIKLSIADVNDRIAMINDVSARVTFMKRDVSTLMRFYQQGIASCNP